MPAPAAPEPVVRDQSPPNEGEGVLSEEFWNKLMDNVPAKGDVKYEYPSR